MVWASQNIAPKFINPVLTASERYVMGSHATWPGALASGEFAMEKAPVYHLVD